MIFQKGYPIKYYSRSLANGFLEGTILSNKQQDSIDDIKIKLSDGSIVYADKNGFCDEAFNGTCDIGFITLNFDLDVGDKIKIISEEFSDNEIYEIVDIYEEEYLVKTVFEDCYNQTIQAQFFKDYILEDLLDTTISYDERLELAKEVPNYILIPESNTGIQKQKNKGNTMKEVITKNKESVVNAAKIVLGKNAIKTLQKTIRPKLPMIVRGYSEHPLFGIVLANAFNYAIQAKLPDNEKAMMVADAMMDASMLMAAEEFDFEGIVQDFIDSLVFPKDIKTKNQRTKPKEQKPNSNE